MYYCNVDYLKLCCVLLIECWKKSISLAMNLSNLRYQCILVLFTKESTKAYALPRQQDWILYMAIVERTQPALETRSLTHDKIKSGIIFFLKLIFSIFLWNMSQWPKISLETECIFNLNLLFDFTCLIHKVLVV